MKEPDKKFFLVMNPKTASDTKLYAKDTTLPRNVSKQMPSQNCQQTDVTNQNEKLDLPLWPAAGVTNSASLETII